MKSLENKLIDAGYHTVNPKLFKEISEMESDFFKLKNECLDLLQDDQKCLVDISRKLSAAHKNLGENELAVEITLMRAKILDHFTLAYLAEMNLKPSEIKLVQSVNAQNEVEIYFEKKSEIIL